MDRLARELCFYFKRQLDHYPTWKNIQVILSDSNVPGEGGHTFMNVIRSQRQSPTQGSNKRNCVYGADNDLILLGLATPEPSLTILRDSMPLYRHNLQTVT